MNTVIFGGQYGSEGKGAASEFIATSPQFSTTGRGLVAIGDNSPNAGHNCSLGKTRSIPAASFWATVVVLGPDAVVHMDILRKDILSVIAVNKKLGRVIIHANAARCYDVDASHEAACGIVGRVGSTGSGSGYARHDKFFGRQSDRVVSAASAEIEAIENETGIRIDVISGIKWLDTMTTLLSNTDAIFECSQGLMLDTNLGIYPYVTSRSTLPQVALARNGLDGIGEWHRVGVYRCHPIRTGGNTGPTFGEELTWGELGVEQEIAAVTGRIRRVFSFDENEFAYSLALSRPDMVLFTHVDYLDPETPVDIAGPVHELFAEKLATFLEENGALEMVTRIASDVRFSFRSGDFHDFIIA